jgi:hypothetical protein
VRQPLILHPDCQAGPVASIEVAIASGEGGLRLDYALRGDIAALSLPLTLPRARASDPLWEHSCFEAFIGMTGSDIYTELNFATWGGWAAYGFTSYRSGMGLLTGIDPIVRTEAGADFFRLSATLPGKGDQPQRLGLSAVIEETDGARSYWALAHPPGKPDFHHPTCFALELPAARAP